MVQDVAIPTLGGDNPPCRRFGIGDAMILIAAIAPGLVVLPLHLPYMLAVAGEISGEASIGWASLRDALFGPSLLGPRIASGLVNLFVPFAFPLTVAHLMFRLRRPRPPLVRLARQPGMVACVAADLGFLILVGLYSIQRLPLLSTVVVTIVGGLVILGWLVLAVSGRWWTEPGWIDRLGIVLGAIWIATVPLFFYLSRFDG